nr:MAG TPA: hypothetical protein [Caudoviricetes sp.]
MHFFLSFLRKIPEIETNYRALNARKGYRGTPLKRHPLCIAVAFENSPGDIFEKWLRFWGGI